MLESCERAVCREFKLLFIVWTPSINVLFVIKSHNKVTGFCTKTIRVKIINRNINILSEFYRAMGVSWLVFYIHIFMSKYIEWHMIFSSALTTRQSSVGVPST